MERNFYILGREVKRKVLHKAKSNNSFVYHRFRIYMKIFIKDEHTHDGQKYVAQLDFFEYEITLKKQFKYGARAYNYILFLIKFSLQICIIKF